MKRGFEYEMPLQALRSSRQENKVFHCFALQPCLMLMCRFWANLILAVTYLVPVAWALIPHYTRFISYQKTNNLWPVFSRRRMKRTGHVRITATDFLTGYANRIFVPTGWLFVLTFLRPSPDNKALQNLHIHLCIAKQWNADVILLYPRRLLHSFL